MWCPEERLNCASNGFSEKRNQGRRSRLTEPWIRALKPHGSIEAMTKPNRDIQVTARRLPGFKKNAVVPFWMTRSFLNGVDSQKNSWQNGQKFLYWFLQFERCSLLACDQSLKRKGGMKKAFRGFMAGIQSERRWCQKGNLKVCNWRRFINL